MKPDKAGANPGITLQRLLNDSTHDAQHVRTCFVVKSWSQPAMAMACIEILQAKMHRIELSQYSDKKKTSLIL
jgi:hypothetical protein